MDSGKAYGILLLIGDVRKGGGRRERGAKMHKNAAVLKQPTTKPKNKNIVPRLFK